MTPDHAPAGFHMTPEEFRRHGHAMIDWIADYATRVESFPVLSRAAPGSIRAALPAEPPARGESFESMLADVERVILPGITHWQSPNFFAYFPANTSGPSILGELLSAGLGVQGMLWATSPACTELETHVLDWFAGMLGLPERFRSTSLGGGVIQDSASSSALCALVAARERTLARHGGPAALARLTVYLSSQTHSSIEKMARVAGLDRSQLRMIDVDERYAMRPARLREQMAADRAAGHLPCFVAATLGTTSSNAIDPVPEIGPICREADAWLHVDAAMSGPAAICPEHRGLHAGLEHADSYCANPHKWMFTNFDCDCFYVADRAALVRALTILPEYLRNAATESGAVIDYRDWQIPLGRRFRALKLWFVIRHYGVEGLQHHLRRHIALAQDFRAWVEASGDFEVVAPAPFNLVCFRHRAGDAFNEALVARLNESGRLYLTHTRLDGRYVMRLCVGQAATEARHVEAAWRRIRETAAALVQEGAAAAR